VIAVDTNILVYAERADSGWHEAAGRVLQELAESSSPWAIPWPCIHEFLAVVTNHRIWKTPTPLPHALKQVAYWMESPDLVVLAEGPGYWPALESTLQASAVSGARVHDARIAALCQHHGVSVLWSADRDFSRFATVRTINPLVRPRP
jgi:hypothetical protein